MASRHMEGRDRTWAIGVERLRECRSRTEHSHDARRLVWLLVVAEIVHNHSGWWFPARREMTWRRLHAEY